MNNYLQRKVLSNKLLKFSMIVLQPVRFFLDRAGVRSTGISHLEIFALQMIPYAT